MGEIITIIILIVALIVVLVLISKPTTKNISSDKVSKKNENNKSVKKESKKNNNNIKKEDLFDFLEFDKISDDMIYQNKGQKFSMVLQCKGVNYDLMSEVEQLAVEEGFINFLNTLKSPIQIYVQARSIDLKNNLDMYKEKIDKINNEYLQVSEEYEKALEDSSVSNEELRELEMQKERSANMLEYTYDITKYVERMSYNKHLLQRKFYIIISYYKSELYNSESFSKDEIDDLCRRELYTRAQTLVSSLQSCSVSAKVLNSNELAELLYISYNRDDAKLIDIRTALDSGFYRLYTTTKDIQEKKDELIEKEVREEARLRAKEAIQAALIAGTIKTKDDAIEDFEMDADTEAVKIIEDADIPENLKLRGQQIIIDSHNEGVVEREKERNKKAKAKKEENDNKIDDNEDVEKLEKNDDKVNNENSENDSIV